MLALRVAQDRVVPGIFTRSGPHGHNRSTQPKGRHTARVGPLPGAAALCALGIAGFTGGSVVVATSQGDSEAALAQTCSSTDLLNGLIPVELPGDQGWHPANPASGNSMAPTGLPAFTDGIGAVTGLEGLLNDFPGAGNPAKRIQYSLGGPKVINEGRVFTGNEGRDGRVFHTYTLEMSADGGASWLAPIYVQSHLSGTVNTARWRAVLTQITDTGGPLASGVTDMRFQFFAVDDTGWLGTRPSPPNNAVIGCRTLRKRHGRDPIGSRPFNSVPEAVAACAAGLPVSAAGESQ